MKISARFVSLLALVASTAFAQTATDVGDPDSFGRSVRYLGLKSTPTVVLLPDCTPNPADPLEEGARCLTTPALPGGLQINETNLGTMRLPANASRSLLCFTIQPVGYLYFYNPTQVNHSLTVSLRSMVTIQSDVLNNPALVNPQTGTPFNGRIDLTLSFLNKGRTLPPGHSEHETLLAGRNCMGGLLSRRALIDQYGLSSLQAATLFARPITLSFGLGGLVRGATDGYVSYGMRIYGD
ncbi:MAG TPA: hypothetical protein VFO36_05545 [Nitrospiraceae bacterium]|nr:hypothetical protein [Nitrospiraceae bacterium]